MSNHNWAESQSSSECAFVYYYLLIGFGLALSALVFLPRVAVG